MSHGSSKGFHTGKVHGNILAPGVFLPLQGLEWSYLGWDAP